MSLLLIPMLVLLAVWVPSTWIVLGSGKGVSPLHGWMVGLSFFVVLPLVIIVINGGYTVPSYYGVEGSWGSLDLSDERFLLPFFFVWTNLVLVAFVAAFMTKRWGAVRRIDVSMEISHERMNRAALVVVGLTLLDLSLNIYARGGIRAYFLLHWYTRNADTLATYGDFYVIYAFFSLALQLTLAATTAMCVLRKFQTGRGGLAMAVGLATMAMNMVVSGNRIFIALLLLFMGAAALHLRRYRAIVKMLLLVPLLVVLFAVWAQVRGALSDPVAAVGRHIDSASTYEGNYVLNRLIDVTEGTNIIFLLNIIKDFGQKYEYLEGVTFLKTVTFWIPRSMYPDKPESFPTITARLYEPGVETSISSTVIGELYANFGYFALVLLPFLTVLVFAVDRWVTSRMSRNYLLSTALFLVFAWMARASFSDNFVMMGFAVMLIWGLRLQSGLLVAKVLKPRIAAMPG